MSDFRNKERLANDKGVSWTNRIGGLLGEFGPGSGDPPSGSFEDYAVHENRPRQNIGDFGTDLDRGTLAKAIGSRYGVNIQGRVVRGHIDTGLVQIQDENFPVVMIN